MNPNQVVQVRKPKLMALVLMIGAFIGLFSETALNMALTNIMEQFSISAAQVQWLTTGYLLTLGVFVPISAFLIKWFSTKKLVSAALIFSILGSLIGALAPNFEILLIARIIQALGTGLLLPLLMNVVLLIFPINKRGVVMGLMGLVITTAPAVGPTVAGIIVDLLDWSYIFWLSLALYLLLFIFGLKLIENVSTLTKPKIDIFSIFLSTIGFGTLIFSLSSLAENAFASQMVLIPLIIGILAILLFTIRQLKMPQPMLNLTVFKYPMFSLGTLHLFIGMLLILSTAILLPMYLKSSLLYSAAIAGLIMLPGSALNAVFGPVVGKLFDKLGPTRLLPIGFTLTTIGSVLFILTVKEDASFASIMLSNMVFFSGIAFIIMPAQTNGMNQLPRELYADGSAIANTLQQIAGAAGTAVAITLLMKGESNFLENNLQASVEQSVAAGTNFAFYFTLIISVIGLISSFFVKKVKV